MVESFAMPSSVTFVKYSHRVDKFVRCVNSPTPRSVTSVTLRLRDLRFLNLASSCNAESFIPVLVKSRCVRAVSDEREDNARSVTSHPYNVKRASFLSCG